MGSVRVRGQRFTALYRTETGKQRSAGTYGTVKEAEHAWRAAELGILPVEIHPDQAGDGNSVTAYAEQWINYHAVEENTRQVYNCVLRTHILPGIGSLRLNKVRQADVRRWLRTMEQNKVNANTVRKCRAVASAMFRTALEEELIRSNPCLGVRITAPPLKIMNIVTPEQFDKLILEIPAEHRLFVRTAIESGLRFGELRELRPSDLVGSDLHVRRAVMELHGPVFLPKPYPKNRRHRVVQISPELAGEIRAVGHGDDLLFTHDGGYIGGGWWRKYVWQPACQRAGLDEGLQFRHLRDSHASWLLAGAADAAIVRDRLGHGSLSTTNRYLGTLPDAGNQALAAFKTVPTWAS